MRCASASAVPRGHVSPAGTGADNGSARIQTRPVKTRTTSAWTVTPEEQGLRLDRFLAAAGRLGSRGRVRVALERGQVFVNEVEASAKDAGSRVASGDAVRLWADRPGSARLRTFGALRRGKPPPRRTARSSTRTRSLLVVNKPAGLLAVPLGRRKDSASAYSLMAEHLGPRGRRQAVHRPSHRSRHVRDRRVREERAGAAGDQEPVRGERARARVSGRSFTGAHGRPKADGAIAWHGTEDALKQTATDAKNPQGVEAISDYRVLETFAETSLVEVRLITGKRNQIRIQAALRGHRAGGEKRYVADAERCPVRPFRGRRCTPIVLRSGIPPTIGC